jgi:hypothetical protein
MHSPLHWWGFRPNTDGSLRVVLVQARTVWKGRGPRKLEGVEIMEGTFVSLAEVPATQERVRASRAGLSKSARGPNSASLELGEILVVCDPDGGYGAIVFERVVDDESVLYTSWSIPVGSERTTFGARAGVRGRLARHESSEYDLKSGPWPPRISVGGSGQKLWWGWPTRVFVPNGWSFRVIRDKPIEEIDVGDIAYWWPAGYRPPKVEVPKGEDEDPVQRPVLWR